MKLRPKTKAHPLPATKNSNPDDQGLSWSGQISGSSARDKVTDMDLSERLEKPRPWTVYVLVILSAAGLVGNLTTSGSPSAPDILLALFSLWVAYSLWTGRSWAFTVSFMLASLCAGLVVVIGLVQLLLLEQGLHQGLLWSLAVSAVWIVLLMHPATKRFADLERSRGGAQVRGT